MNHSQDMPGDAMEEIARDYFPGVMRAPVTSHELVVAGLKLPGKGLFAELYKEFVNDGKAHDFLSELAMLHGMSLEEYIDRNASRLEQSDSNEALIDQLAFRIIMNAVTMEHDVVEELKQENEAREKGGRKARPISRKSQITHWVSMLEPYDELKRKNPSMYDAANRKVARVLAAIGMSKAVPDSTMTPWDGIRSSDTEDDDVKRFLDAMGTFLIKAGNSALHDFAATMGFPSMNAGELARLREILRNAERQRKPEDGGGR